MGGLGRGMGGHVCRRQTGATIAFSHWPGRAEAPRGASKSVMSQSSCDTRTNFRRGGEIGLCGARNGPAELVFDPWSFGSHKTVVSAFRHFGNHSQLRRNNEENASPQIDAPDPYVVKRRVSKFACRKENIAAWGQYGNV